MSRPNWSTLGVLPPLVLERAPSTRVAEIAVGDLAAPAVVDRHLRLGVGQVARRRASSASGSPGGTSASGVSSGAQARARTTPRTRSARASRSRESLGVRWPRREQRVAHGDQFAGGSTCGQVEERLGARGHAQAVDGRRRPSSASSRRVHHETGVLRQHPRGVTTTCGGREVRSGAPSSAAAVVEAEGRVGGQDRREQPTALAPVDGVGQRRRRGTAPRIARRRPRRSAVGVSAGGSRGMRARCRSGGSGMPSTRGRCGRSGGRGAWSSDLWTALDAVDGRPLELIIGRRLSDTPCRAATTDDDQLSGGAGLSRRSRRASWSGVSVRSAAAAESTIDAGREAPGIGRTTSACARCQASVTR